MKRRRILYLWLVLLMLVMTACGKSQNVASEPAQESKVNVQIVEPIMPELVSRESSKAEDTESEDQGQSDEQEDEAEIHDDSDIKEESDAQTEEAEGQEDEQAPQASEVGDSQEETVNNNLPVQGNYYYDVVNVVLYLEIYGELPPNYITKSEAQALGWEGGSVEKYKEGAAIGGDYFGNREGLLPAADGRSYTECDIDTHGYKSRGSRRLLFSNDGLYFYTSDHYESFSEVTVTDNYEVIW